MEDVRGRRRVEVAGGLVGEQQRGRVGERAGNGGALLLAARELCRPVVEAFGETQRPSSCSRHLAGARATPLIICGMRTFSSAENSGSS